MMRFVIAYVAAGLWLLVVDAVWLSSMVSVYRQHLGDLLHDGFRLAPAIAFYLLYVFGIVWFAIMPTLNSGGSWQQAALNGALLGLVAYGTYDLTNHATLKTWPAFITVMDMAWGAFLTGTAAVAGTLAARAFASGSN
jgi:uncharacterized membrane protein